MLGADETCEVTRKESWVNGIDEAGNWASEGVYGAGFAAEFLVRIGARNRSVTEA